MGAEDGGTRPALEIHYADDWAGLYVDGILDRVGDAYCVEERAFALAGVTQVQDAAFMRGQTQADGVAQTLADVEAYRVKRASDEQEAARLREQAAELLQRAAALDSKPTA
jgi:hypothetical protein